MSEDVRLLRIYLPERARRGGSQPAYTALVEAARKAGIAGATVLKAIEGYHGHAPVHAARVVDLAANLPIVIEIVDAEDRLRAFLPTIDELLPEGLVVWLPVEVLLRRFPDESTSTERGGG